jgi:hypothetical protein
MKNSGYPRLTHFTTRLPQMMDLVGSWEIGLTEIQYPHSWYNIKKREAWVHVDVYLEVNQLSHFTKYCTLLPFRRFFQSALDLVYVVLFNDFLYLFGIKCSFQNFTVVVFDVKWLGYPEFFNSWIL